jgi:hypothetical protein
MRELNIRYGPGGGWSIRLGGSDHALLEALERWLGENAEVTTP